MTVKLCAPFWANAATQLDLTVHLYRHDSLGDVILHPPQASYGARLYTTASVGTSAKMAFVRSRNNAPFIKAQARMSCKRLTNFVTDLPK